jgi:ATP-dependent RNA helicase DDX18/HAS1
MVVRGPKKADKRKKSVVEEVGEENSSDESDAASASSAEEDVEASSDGESSDNGSKVEESVGSEEEELSESEVKDAESESEGEEPPAKRRAALHAERDRPMPKAARTELPTKANSGINSHWLTDTKFDSLGLSEETMSGIKNMGFDTLTKIQEKAIPLGLAGRDVLGMCSVAAL